MNTLMPDDLYWKGICKNIGVTSDRRSLLQRNRGSFVESKHGNLIVRTIDNDLEISNCQVSILLFIKDGGYVQEFHAVDRKGQSKLLLSSLHKNLIPSSEHRVCTSPMIAGDRPHLFTVCRESLRMVYSRAEITHHDQERIEVCLSGSAQGHSLECYITLNDGSNTVHITVMDKIERNGFDPLIEYLMSSYAFLPGGAMVSSASELSYAWAPNLRPVDNHVIGDCSFHSPAIIVQKGQDGVALIPDLHILSDNRTMPTALDLDMQNGLLPTPLLSYGFCNYETTDSGKYCSHDVTMSMRLKNPQLTFGYSLILNTDCKNRPIYKEASSYIWRNYRSKAKHHSYKYSSIEQRLSSNLLPDAQAAYGLYTHNDRKQVAKAMKNALLSSPQDNGLFSTKFDSDTNTWAGCNYSIDEGYYHTLECSEQLYWLLKWHGNIEKDPRIISYCRKYADYLISSKLRTGAIPSWFTKDHVPLSALRSSIQTAMSAMFLTELSKVTGLKKYMNAAESSTKFIITKLLPHYLYQDYTMMDIINSHTTECSDPHTCVQPQSGLGMLWSARLCLDLYKLTNIQPYLKQGQRILDQMCLLQSVWSLPSLVQNQPYGICVKGNLGVHCDAVFSAEFARCAIEYGMVLGESEYIERGAAALRAAQSIQGSALSQAKVAASAALIRDMAGSVFVHIRKKWAVPTNGAQIQHLNFEQNKITIDINAANDEDALILFGGVNGRTYNLRINGHHLACTADQMKCGIMIPIIPAQHGQYVFELQQPNIRR